MKDKNLLQQVTKDIESRQTSSSAASSRGKAPDHGTSHHGASREAMVDAINQVFALFRLNYHNQFYSAYPDNEQLNQVKKLWLEALADYPVEQILRGAKHALEASEYLPTLNRMLTACQEALSELGLPDARTAYLEACTARTPRSAQAWSHPAVYLAGRDAGWHLLETETEQRSWPVFQQHYHHYCQKAIAGENLEIPEPEALPRSSGEVSSREQALAELAKIKSNLSD